MTGTLTSPGRTDVCTIRFTEMPTNKFVESAFWNFDAMFVPQQHPAREMQDTFYIKGQSLAIPASLLNST